MNTDNSQYPYALQHFGLDYYIDPSTKRFTRLPSRHKGSHEAGVNRALDRIEKDDGVYAYLNNRLREKISCIIFAILMGFPPPVLSTVVNDIHFQVDAIGKLEENSFAIDFTEDYNLASQKLNSTDPHGNMNMLGETGQMISLPFIVVTIASALVDRLLLDIETVLTQDPTTELNGPDSHIGQSIADFLRSDRRPDHVFDIHMHMQSRGNLHNRIAELYEKRMHQMST